MRCPAMILGVLLSATVLHAQDDIKVIYDQRPDAGIPQEARFAGTKPDPDSKTSSQSNVSFGIVTDLKDYGPLRNIITTDHCCPSSDLLSAACTGSAPTGEGPVTASAPGAV